MHVPGEKKGVHMHSALAAFKTVLGHRQRGRTRKGLSLGAITQGRRRRLIDAGLNRYRAVSIQGIVHAVKLNAIIRIPFLIRL